MAAAASMVTYSVGAPRKELAGVDDDSREESNVFQRVLTALLHTRYCTTFRATGRKVRWGRDPDIQEKSLAGARRSSLAAALR